MQRQFEEELDEIRKTILSMAGLVEKGLDDVTTALANQDIGLAEAVIAMDEEIDQREVEIDRLATECIARRQRTVTDLRLVIVASEVGAERERIADHAVSRAVRVLPWRAAPGR